MKDDQSSANLLSYCNGCRPSGSSWAGKDAKLCYHQRSEFCIALFTDAIVII